MPNEALQTAPALEPVTATEIQGQIGLTNPSTAQTNLINRLIVDARERVEERQRSALITQTWRQYWNGFPGSDDDLLFRDFRNPIQSITHVKYYDTSGTQQTVATSVYHLNTAARFDTVELKYNQTWPTDVRGQSNDVEIEYIAGHGSSASDVPQRIRRLIELLVTQAWEYKLPCCDCEYLDQLMVNDSYNVAVC